jgi:hypothetical protein
MAKRVSMKHKRMEAPEWVFSWRRPRAPQWPFFIALAISGAVFALLLSSVRIRVSSPVSWTAAKASVIRVLDDVDGRALTLMAREGGPFPSRFDPGEWQWALETGREVYQSARWQAPPYVPTLRELPQRGAAAASRWIAPRGSVLPVRKPTPLAPHTLENRAPQPVLIPLSGIDATSLPRELPPFDAVVDPAMTAEPWRFLLRLGASGAVLDCFPLAGGDKAGPSALDDWLRRVSFKPDPAQASRWIAVGVGFANPPDHGSDAR